MSEKATGRPWSHTGGPRLGGFGGTATVYDGPFEVAEMDVCYAEEVVAAMNAVNNYDELASIAGEMARALGNLENDDGQRMPPSAWQLVQSALSRYTKWKGGQE